MRESKGGIKQLPQEADLRCPFIIVHRAHLCSGKGRLGTLHMSNVNCTGTL
jgi:hypothetical protein